MTVKQVQYLHNLLWSYYTLLDKSDMCSFVNRTLMHKLPYHFRPIKALSDLSAYELALLIKHIKKDKNISTVKPIKQSDTNFVLEPILSFGLFTVYRQVFHDQIKHDMRVACFPNVLMLDMDCGEHFHKFFDEDKWTFRIYKTMKGYHCYCTSRYIPHKSYGLYKTFEDWGCDKRYLMYAYTYGWMVRLSPKTHYENDFVEQFVETIGNVEEDTNIINALVEKDVEIKMFINNIK